MAKVAVKSVEIERAEGLASECIKVTVPTLAEATRTLFQWSHTAPETGGYDKCDFKVTFEDGETYDGRFDMKRHLKDEGSLEEHIQRFVKMQAHVWRPAWMDDKRWTQFTTRTAEHKADALAFIEKYDLGAEVSL